MSHNYRIPYTQNLFSETRGTTAMKSPPTATGVAPTCHNERKPECSNEDTAQPKINKSLKKI